MDDLTESVVTEFAATASSTGYFFTRRFRPLREPIPAATHRRPPREDFFRCGRHDGMVR
jgi:hypothetical protein